MEAIELNELAPEVHVAGCEGSAAEAVIACLVERGREGDMAALQTALGAPPLRTVNGSFRWRAPGAEVEITADGVLLALRVGVNEPTE